MLVVVNDDLTDFWGHLPHLHFAEPAQVASLPPPSRQTHDATLSDKMYLLISFGKSTPLQNRQLNILNSNSGQ